MLQDNKISFISFYPNSKVRGRVSFCLFPHSFSLLQISSCAVSIKYFSSNRFLKCKSFLKMFENIPGLKRDTVISSKFKSPIQQKLGYFILWGELFKHVKNP